MGQADFVQQGTHVDYTPGSAVSAGDVIVQGKLVGVAELNIVSGKLGALAVEGVFNFDKKSADTPAFGALMYWDVSAAEATTTSTSNELIGKAMEAAGSGILKIRIKLDQ